MPGDTATAKLQMLQDKSEHLVSYIGSWISNVGQENKTSITEFENKGLECTKQAADTANAAHSPQQTSYIDNDPVPGNGVTDVTTWLEEQEKDGPWMIFNSLPF